MKISWSWLRDYVTVDATPAEVAKRLTFAGLEVESVAEVGGGFSGVVVAEVLARRAHPKSAKLTIVTVNAGDAPTEVVCGASNVPEAGGKVLWARPGARLPDGRELAVKPVAGVDSPGMLCSSVELGLGEGADGIIVLEGEDAKSAPGTAAQDALGLRDVVLDVNVHANRPDCLGHVGIAREVAALFGVARRHPDATLTEAAAVAVTVTIADPALCPRYTARVIDGVTVGPSPRWLRRRLEAVGVRSINNVVDVTNYVMFELGQPLHAFDFATLAGGRIDVRAARDGETLTTLDGQERALVAGDLLICDGEKPVALAGVMGGAATEVSATTTRVLLESATFAPKSVRRTAKRLQLHSEASHRFERGVDAHGVDFASARAAKLLVEVAGGTVLGDVVDVFPAPPQPAVLTLRPARVTALLGLALDTTEITRCLRALELGVSATNTDALVVDVPSFRVDLEREVDLIEEVARVHGINHVPATLPPTSKAPLAGADPREDLARDALAAAGLDETISYGFTSPARLTALRFPADHPVSRPLALKNPMREEQAVMRTSLLANLLAALAHNLSFGLGDVRLFEIGSVFLPSTRALPDEPRFVAGVLCGERAGWLKPAGALDFYDCKGVVERLLAGLRAESEIIPSRNEQGFLHPGVAAAIIVDGAPAGVLGEVHPETRDRFGIARPCFAFELNLEAVAIAPPRQTAPVWRHPANLRDLSFFVDESVPAAQVIRAVDADRPPLLESLRVLEDYREPGKVPAGKKGMLWSMTYRDASRTLTDAEVDATHEALVARVLRTLGAERR